MKKCAYLIFKIKFMLCWKEEFPCTIHDLHALYNAYVIAIKRFDVMNKVSTLTRSIWFSVVLCFYFVSLRFLIVFLA